MGGMDTHGLLSVGVCMRGYSLAKELCEYALSSQPSPGRRRREGKNAPSIYMGSLGGDLLGIG